jgi:rhamnose transport system permease protein
MPDRWRSEISVAIAILALMIVLAVAAPGFFSSENQSDLLMANVPVLIVALGMTLIILSGEIDISVGSQLAICSIAAGVFAKTGLPAPVAGLAACGAGALMGALNGVLVAWGRIPSIVVTLATMVALRDALRWSTEGAWVQDLPPDFHWFGLSRTGSQVVTCVIAAALVAGAAWALRHTAAGRAVYATGSDQNAARLAGIDPARVVFWVFTITGALTGCAAFLNSVRFSQIPANAGINLEMKVIAAVVVGGASITGGRGTVAGTTLGLILLADIGPALTFLGVSAYWERAVQGAIILGAVAMDAVRARSRARLGRYAGDVAAQRA